MCEFEKQFKWSSFTIISNNVNVKENLSYKELVAWLTTNRLNLFGFYIKSTNHYWNADYFLRYETSISI